MARGSQNGKSNNPKGRPRGLRDLRSYFYGVNLAQAEEIVQMVLNEAQAGDKELKKLVFDKMVPTVRSDRATGQSIALSRCVKENTHKILEAVDKGLLTPDEGIKMMQMVATTAEVSEMKEMKAKLEEIERAQRVSDS